MKQQSEQEEFYRLLNAMFWVIGLVVVIRVSLMLYFDYIGWFWVWVISWCCWVKWRYWGGGVEELG